MIEVEKPIGPSTIGIEYRAQVVRVDAGNRRLGNCDW